jgi:hypothetical protein
LALEDIEQTIAKADAIEEKALAAIRGANGGSTAEGGRAS